MFIAFCFRFVLFGLYMYIYILFALLCLCFIYCVVYIHIHISRLFMNMFFFIQALPSQLIITCLALYLQFYHFEMLLLYFKNLSGDS